jgi:gamma-glutamylcyclotransferase (GGCT)/AIG2-like uncharacterized protein YtfP
MLIFVYGTLRRGEPNHRCLEGARFVREARTLPLYRLIDLGGCPALKPHGTTAVVGEIWDLDDRVLARCDRLEGHPDLYLRTPIAVEGGGEVESYVFPSTRRPSAREITSGDWVTYARHAREEEERCE